MEPLQQIDELRRNLNELRELGTTFKRDLIEIGKNH